MYFDFCRLQKPASDVCLQKLVSHHFSAFSNFTHHSLGSPVFPWNSFLGSYLLPLTHVWSCFFFFFAHSTSTGVWKSILSVPSPSGPHIKVYTPPVITCSLCLSHLHTEALIQLLSTLCCNLLAWFPLHFNELTVGEDARWNGTSLRRQCSTSAYTLLLTVDSFITDISKKMQLFRLQLHRGCHQRDSRGYKTQGRVHYDDLYYIRIHSGAGD